MDKFVIQQSRLAGSVQVSGSKNAALPILAATLLTDDECVIRRVPDLMDIRTMLRILEGLGKNVTFNDGTVKIVSTRKKGHIAPYRLVRTMRASFCVLGPLLGRLKKAKVSLPGGCIIGVRPVDLHIKGLRELGAEIIIERGYCVAHTKKLVGRHVYLGGTFGSSVLATDNIMMAAVLAEGETCIDYAACEPEVENLGFFLREMGADLEGEGTPLIRINGVERLHGCEFEIIPDRIEAGTFIAASMAAQSPIEIRGANPYHLISVIETARAMGVNVEIAKDNAIRVKPNGRLRAVNITTLPYPGFPTDLQAQFMVCLCVSKGMALITEKIYPDRFMHVSELLRMGAGIIRNGPYAIIEGHEELYGAEVMASDLRASAALVVAGLAAHGRTDIFRVYHIDRGYEKVEEKFKALGGKIKREKQ